MRLEQMSDIGLAYSIAETGDPRWTRVFVRRSDDCQIGRLSFAKRYKDSGGFDESDFVMAQFESYVRTGKPITLTEYEALKARVEAYCEEDKQRKLEARKKLPQKSRTAIKGFDPRALFHRVLKGYNAL